MKALHGHGHDGSFGKALILSQGNDLYRGLDPASHSACAACGSMNLQHLKLLPHGRDL
jgi:hypothetical protein